MENQQPNIPTISQQPPLEMVDNGNYQKWDRGGQHASLLYSLVFSDTIKGWTPQKVLAEFPQFQVYNPNNFQSTLHRLKKKKMNLDMQHVTDGNFNALDDEEQANNALRRNAAGGTY
jgi:hypothetical protein